MYSFSYLEPVCCSMSSSNCCMLTCIQISQEAGQVVCYSYLFQNFPQFIVIHTVKGFGIVNKAEIDIFLELSCFFDDPAHIGNLISGSSAFSKTSFNIRKFIIQVIKTFLYSSVYSCHLFLIFSASVRFLPFLSFIMSILVWNVTLIAPIFLKRSLVFPIQLFSSISLHCIQLGVSFPFSLAFFFSSFLSYLWSLPRQPLCLLAFLFLLDGFSLPPVHCCKPLSIVLQALWLPTPIKTNSN